jgi:hypothetical protein
VTSAFEAVRAGAQASSHVRALRTTAGLTDRAAALCSEYGGLRAQMLAGRFSDQVVPGTLLARFFEAAAPLVDDALVAEVNATLWGAVTDGRRPGWPTRAHGIGRRCSSGWGGCTADGFFDPKGRFNTELTERSATWIGAPGDRKVPVYADRRYRSLYTFALMGALLQSGEANYRCEALEPIGLDSSAPIGLESGLPWPLPMAELSGLSA